MVKGPRLQPIVVRGPLIPLAVHEPKCRFGPMR
jgi:hypothetical protein